MASFDSHIKQVRSNLRFLLQNNRDPNEFWDWQVTTCFYVAVHLVNSHIARRANLHYNTHEAVKNALNPYAISICRIDPATYLDYAKLEGLSRRSRYLCSDTHPKKDIEQAHITYDKHFAKALKCLDRLMTYFGKLHQVEWEAHSVFCRELEKTPLRHFEIVGD